MKAPKCRVCESAHWLTEPHVFAKPLKVSELLTQVVVHAKPVVHTVVHSEPKKRSGDRHTNDDARKKYRRDWMKRARAA